ncbi:beta/gamma crystallin-related protein [Leekyejoonella antrihumi]|uniref:Beta/gamma crystallin 'Greek key' domain-containing protein n=1 Tax=Leekyejoonella antrihumi TaxID=1660198 RepID=A0A563DUQ8_9MICO|nr:beta/gamma crystallin-related protein [Leekyejoonella antrihumi]TWP33424.1 hypothetical protein FGL98_21330 [Leekyejoonella antrihumi]
MAARSTTVELQNSTADVLTLGDNSLAHGEWTTRPPATVAAQATVTWESESNGFMTGTEGHLTYHIGSGGDDVNINWDNPFSGTNSYQASANPPFGASFTGGSGNNATVTMVLTGNGTPGGPPSGAARSTDSTLLNATGLPLARTGIELDHGIWVTTPPISIGAGQTGGWRTESSGFLTGTEGRATYQGGSVTATVHWDNPYVGSNSADGTASGGDSRLFELAGSGDNSTSDFALWRSAAPPEIILFEHANFHGRHKHLCADEPDLAAPEDNTFNDIVSSIVVVSGVWEVFADIDYGRPYVRVGTPVRLGPGIYPNLDPVGITNDDLSSLRLTSNSPTVSAAPILGHAVLFKAVDFQGEHKHVFNDEPDLAAADDNTFNDTVSSLAIVSGQWQLYRDINAQTPMGASLLPGLYPDLGALGAGGALSSLQVCSTAAVATVNQYAGHLIVFEHNFRGRHWHLFTSTALADLGASNLVSSAVVFAGNWTMGSPDQTRTFGPGLYPFSPQTFFLDNDTLADASLIGCAISATSTQPETTTLAMTNGSVVNTWSISENAHLLAADRGFAAAGRTDLSDANRMNGNEQIKLSAGLHTLHNELSVISPLFGLPVIVREDVTVDVQAYQAPAIDAFYATPGYITTCMGQASIQVTWSVRHATALTVARAGTPIGSRSGSYDSAWSDSLSDPVPQRAQTSYRLTATSPGGSATADVAVGFGPPPGAVHIYRLYNETTEARTVQLIGYPAENVLQTMPLGPSASLNVTIPNCQETTVAVFDAVTDTYTLQSPVLTGSDQGAIVGPIGVS